MLVNPHLLACDSTHPLLPSLAIMRVPTLFLPPDALAVKAELSDPLRYDMSLTQGPRSADDQGQDCMPDHIIPKYHKIRCRLIRF